MSALMFKKRESEHLCALNHRDSKLPCNQECILLENDGSSR